MTTFRDSQVRDESAAVLRAAMVRELREMDAIVSDSVAAAVAAVPRHLFAQDEPLEAVYAANTALVIKRDADGVALSSLSAAHIQAVMLEQAGIEPGMRVLEIGSGGYNAALIAELVGQDGAVVSVDIDPQIVQRARTCLDEAGYQRVQVMLGDAQNGAWQGAPWDRIVVTAAAWDIPPAWIEQLSTDGRIVVPLRMRGLTRSIAFDRESTSLVSSSYRLCGFVPMQGEGAREDHIIQFDEHAALRLDDDQVQHVAAVDTAALREALYGPRAERWSGAAFDLPDELELFLATAAPTVMLHARQALVDQGVVAASATRGVPALVAADGSFAYRTKRPNQTLGGFESGVFAHGPDAASLAERYVQLLRTWAGRHRRRGAARIQYLPSDAVAPGPGAGVITKRHGTILVRFA